MRAAADRYTGAASRLTGSQNAASNFALNSGNKDPKDIVTDGAHLWAVNSSTTDKVFKYTAAGALVGSWTLSTSGATSPTGITLDPASPSHLWIVDSGTDRVYQYDNAAAKTSGSQAASTSFLLAAGNSNPQGIADPPVGMETSSTLSASAATDPVDTRIIGDARHGLRNSEVDRLLTDGNWNAPLDLAAPAAMPVTQVQPLAADADGPSDDAQHPRTGKLRKKTSADEWDEAIDQLAAELAAL